MGSIIDIPTEEVSSRMPLSAEQQAELLLTIATKCLGRVPTESPVVGQLVFIMLVPPSTPLIERIGELVGYWSFVPTKDEVWMIGLLNGEYIKWSNVTVLSLPAQLSDGRKQWA
jgi:hypothetical protein